MELTIGWILLVAAANCAVGARKVDLELRRLMPPRIDLRDRFRAHWDPEESEVQPRLGGLVNPAEFERLGHQLQSLGEGVVPDRWKRRSHADAGAALVERFWLLVAASFLLGAVGLGVIAVGAS